MRVVSGLLLILRTSVLGLTFWILQNRPSTVDIHVLEERDALTY